MSATGASAGASKLTKVCVTGASGFIASHLVKQLLESGKYIVRGTVRNLGRACGGSTSYSNKKLNPLLRLAHEFGPQNLELVEADLLKEGSFDAAVEDCEGVFHTASPFFHNTSNPQKDLVDPALLGTKNVLDSVVREIKRSTDAQQPQQQQRRMHVVLTSSIAAVYENAVKGKRYREWDWNTESTIETKPYYYSKTVAERAAWDYFNNRDNRIDLSVINPPLVIGPVLVNADEQPVLNTSVDRILAYLRGNHKYITSRGGFGIVDVRDVARAHILAFENKRQSVGHRFICSAGVVTMQQACAIMKREFPQLPIPTELDPSKDTSNKEYVIPIIDNSKIREMLGIQFRSIDASFRDTCASLIERGFLSDLHQQSE